MRVYENHYYKSEQKKLFRCDDFFSLQIEKMSCHSPQSNHKREGFRLIDSSRRNIWLSFVHYKLFTSS